MKVDDVKKVYINIQMGYHGLHFIYTLCCLQNQKEWDVRNKMWCQRNKKWTIVGSEKKNWGKVKKIGYLGCKEKDVV